MSLGCSLVTKEQSNALILFGHSLIPVVFSCCERILTITG